MRRSLVLASILAVSTAVLGACDPKTNTTPERPVSTPVPVATASPLASPAASPSVDPKASPAKPVASPVAKKPDGANVKMDVKPAAAESPKK